MKPTSVIVLPWRPDYGGGVNEVALNLYRETLAAGEMQPLIMVTEWSAARLREQASDGGEGVRTVDFRLWAPWSKGGSLGRLLKWLLAAPLMVFDLLRFCRRHRVVAFSFHYPSLSAFPIALLRFLHLYRGALILSFHGLDLQEARSAGRIERALWSFVLHRATAIVACSRALAAEVEEFAGMPAGQVAAIHNGVDIGHLVASVDRSNGGGPPAELRDRRFILSVATFEPKKGLDVLVRAFAAVRCAHPGLALVLVGRSSDAEANLRALAAKLGIASDVLFCKDVPHSQVGLFLERAAVFCLPSRSEPFGIALLEAAAYRLPVVASRVGGIPEVVDDGETGLLVEPGDIQALAAALDRVLRDAKGARDLAERFHQRVATRFSWRRAHDAYRALVQLLVLCVWAVAGACGSGPPPGVPLLPVRTEVHGVLRRANAPSPFFSPDGKRAILLVGSHTWNNFQDLGFTSPPPVFDYEGFLDSLSAWNHNFFRLYVWEQAKFAAGTPRPYWVAPLPYLRTGPGVALDDLPKFDLGKWNEAYFTRLHERVAAARRRGIYVSVMLFNGWSLEGKGGKQHGNPWPGHPFNAANNVNGIDADRDHDGEGKEAHRLGAPAVLAIQERYVRKVVATVRDLDNVLFEISNESAPGSAAWQYHMIRVIHDAERTLPTHHPVGMTVEWPDGDNALLTASPADWFSPNGDLEQPPRVPFPGGKVVVWDTDHLCGMCASIGWVWKGFLSGYNPILMDGWDGRATDIGFAPYERADPKWELARRNLGYALTIANRMNLARLTPRPDLASTGYCLADTTPGAGAFLVYVRRGGRVRRAAVDVDLRSIPKTDTLRVQWLNLRNGTIRAGRPVTGGGRTRFTEPVRAESLLILERR